MQSRSIVGLFCEDIRAEKSGAFTLVGIMPDNVNVPERPTAERRGMIPKLCVYVRANFDADDEIKSMSMSMRLPDGNELEIGSAGDAVITKAFDGARKKGSPIATIVMRAEFQGFPIVALGQIFVDMNINGAKSIAAQLNLTHGEKPVEAFEEVSHVTKTLKVTPTASSTP